MKAISIQSKQKISSAAPPPERVIGLDNHPDSFTAAFLIGNDAAKAKVLKVQDHIAQERLAEWINEHTTERDVVVMEASANSFEAVEVFRAHDRKAVVLESQQCGQIGSAYCATDRVDAIKLARIYISGLPKQVWVPDASTRLRREVFYAYTAAVKDSTRARQRIRGFLNQHRIRLPKGFKLTAENAPAKFLALREWEPTQVLLLNQFHSALREAHLRRAQLREVMAAELLKEPAILRLIRLCGLRHITAFALAAFIGDITRFANPKRLVAYIGVNPGVCDSGQTKGSTQLRHNGCAPLRALMVQAAQAILRTPGAVFSKWGHQLIMRRGRNRATVAVARKLVTAVWYCLSGQFTALEEVPANVTNKLKLLIAGLGSRALETLGSESLSDYLERLLQNLKQSHSLIFRACT
jgi:transposase